MFSHRGGIENNKSSVNRREDENSINSTIEAEYKVRTAIGAQRQIQPTTQEEMTMHDVCVCV